MNQIHHIYKELLKKYGHQGWWPLLDVARKHAGKQPTKTGSVQGYHPGNYSYPQTDAQHFEICTGAILTQNTGWMNVEKALVLLADNGLLDPQSIVRADDTTLKQAIKSAGYFNQKAKKLKIFANFFLAEEKPTRKQLLSLWGIGPETADSILLYAYKRPVFVVDAYTRRIFSRLGFFDIDTDYDEIQALFERSLPPDYRIYQEYHALIVEHAKRCYMRTSTEPCFLERI
ncbi:endonuclease III domain-containing protein [Candidatus Woesearchaeota archaeon]|nr:endonuclease III domain-containing protein [Candidatus Woesearchaeota archaeon]